MKRLGFFIVLIISLIIVFKTTISATNYIVVLNTTTSVTEAQVRNWLNDVGYEPLTLLERVDVVDGKLTTSSVGGGWDEDIFGKRTYLALPSTIQFEAQSLLAHPWATAGHEYGHVWSNYFKWTYWQGSWNAYLVARGIDPADPRLGNYPSCWNPEELIAEDYRDLFARPETTPGVIVVPYATQCGWPMARDILGFRNWLALTFTQGHPPPGYFNTPTPTSIATSTPTTVLTATKTPTPGIKTPTPTKCPKGWSRRNIC